VEMNAARELKFTDRNYMETFILSISPRAHTHTHTQIIHTFLISETITQSSYVHNKDLNVLPMDHNALTPLTT
jgi:hypothetical protein